MARTNPTHKPTKKKSTISTRSLFTSTSTKPKSTSSTKASSKTTTSTTRKSGATSSSTSKSKTLFPLSKRHQGRVSDPFPLLSKGKGKASTTTTRRSLPGDLKLGKRKRDDDDVSEEEDSSSTSDSDSSSGSGSGSDEDSSGSEEEEEEEGEGEGEGEEGEQSKESFYDEQGNLTSHLAEMKLKELKHSPLLTTAQTDLDHARQTISTALKRSKELFVTFLGEELTQEMLKCLDEMEQSTRESQATFEKDNEVFEQEIRANEEKALHLLNTLDQLVKHYQDLKKTTKHELAEYRKDLDNQLEVLQKKFDADAEALKASLYDGKKGGGGGGGKKKK